MPRKSEAKAAAIAAGDKTYIGRPCKYGHEPIRYVSGSTCKECLDIASRKQRSEHPEKNRAYVKKCEAKHLQKTRARRKEYMKCSRLNNPELHKEAFKKWLAGNKDRLAEIQSNWRSRNREILNVHNRNRRAIYRSCEGKHTPEDIRDIRRLQRNKCACCRVELVGAVKVHVDHIIAIVNGGSNKRSNLQVLCSTCNIRKNNKDPIDFMRSQGFLL